MSFKFRGDLFEKRASLTDALLRNDIELFNGFSGIDLDHDDNGLEVEGIKEKAVALMVKDIATKLFPNWKYNSVYYNERGASPGWKVSISEHTPDTTDNYGQGNT